MVAAALEPVARADESKCCAISILGGDSTIGRPVPRMKEVDVDIEPLKRPMGPIEGRSFTSSYLPE